MHKLAAPEMKLKTFKEPLLDLRYKKRVRTKNCNFLRTLVQWNPVNTTTFGPWKFGRINGVVVLTG